MAGEGRGADEEGEDKRCFIRHAFAFMLVGRVHIHHYVNGLYIIASTTIQSQFAVSS